MGKDKKGKKGRQEEDFGEEEVDVDNAKGAGNDASGNTKVVKKGKRGRRKDDDWEDDVAKEIEALSLDNSIASNLKSASSKNEAEDKKLVDDEPDFSFTSKREKKKKKEIECEGEDVDEEVSRTKQSKNQKGKKDKDEGSDEDDEFKWDNKGARKKGKAVGSDADGEDEIINGKQPKKQKGKKGKLFGSDEEDILMQKKDNKVTKKKSKSVISDDEELIEQTEKIQTKKQKGRKAKGDFSDEEVEHVVDQKKDSKGKKKGMKGKGDVSVDEDETNDVEIKTKKQKDKGDKVKKKGKKSKGKDIGSDEEEDEEPVLRSKAAKKDNVGKIKTKTGFQLLEMEDMDIDDDSNDDISVEIEVTATSEKDTKLKNQLKQDSVETEDQDIDIKKDDKGSKKSKKKERKKRDDDEEVDKMLEELAMEIDGKKPPEKAKEKVKDGIEDTLVEGEIKLEEISEKQSKKKKKKKGDIEPQEEKKEEDKEPQVEEAVEEEDRTVKTAAQKKKEKKERERQKKLAQNEQDRSKKKGDAKAEEMKLDDRAEKIETKDTEAPVVVDEDDTDDKKKKKKKKKDEEEKKDKKRPGKKQIAAMQEALKKVKEEEERLRLEEEAKQKAAEEAEQKRQEKLRLEQERKEKKKQKEKEKRERLKAEGKLLTRSQRQARARMEATLQALRQQGVEVPQIGEKKERAPRLGDRKRPPKKKADEQDSNVVHQKVEVKIIGPSEQKAELPEHEENVIEKENKETKGDTEINETLDTEVKEAWDETTEDEGDDDEDDDGDILPKTETEVLNTVSKQVKKEESEEETEESESEEESSTEKSESEEESSDESEEEGKKQEAKIKERAAERITRRREEAEKNRSTSKLRSPVVCVLGHVDTGKTKILDKIRRTHVQDSEAGGITQQIGATMVPQDALKDQCKMVKNFVDVELKVPGLLIIDTPGHESFSNLRSRGSSLCDIAILVVDIMHGLEPQTIESLNLLKQKKTPFIVALNKVDRLYEWKTVKNKDIQDVIKSQARNTKMEFEDRAKDVILQFANQGMNATLFYENKDPRSYISMVPTSAFTGDGMGNLMALIVELTQSMMAKRLAFSEELQATVLEVKAIPGLGTTIDVILVNGRLREGDTILLAAHDGPLVTQIRSLLMPQPLKELRVKNPYQEYKEVEGAQGVKIAGKDLDKAIAGLQLLVAHHPDEVEVLKDEVSSTLREAMSSIKLAERGVYVQASTLGSLEALLEFLKVSKIPYSGIRIGPVVKKDVMKASIMLEHDSQYAVILAFDVKVERDAQELADNLGVKIFQADIIYHLFDKFMAYRDELKQKKRDEFKNVAVFPCKLRILPQYVFNSRDPIVVGVIVEAGVIKDGTPLCVPSKEFLEIGTVTTIEVNHKSLETARRGQEVCIKIEPSGGEAPKMYGRHFDHTDMLVSKITRQSIDVCKEYFRDDLLKTDWQLMVELKKIFQIL